MITKNKITAGVNYKEDDDVIEDEITRTRRFRKYKQDRIKKMKQLKVPQILIDREEYEAQMTHREYEIYREEMAKQAAKEYRQRKSEYAKDHKLEKTKVDALYEKGSSIEYHYLVHSLYTTWLMSLDPVSITGKDDFENGLYDDIINHVWDTYKEKYKSEYQESVKIVEAEYEEASQNNV